MLHRWVLFSWNASFRLRELHAQNVASHGEHGAHPPVLLWVELRQEKRRMQGSALRTPWPPALLRDLVDQGHLGRKSGRGFYDNSDGDD